MTKNLMCGHCMSVGGGGETSLLYVCLNIVYIFNIPLDPVDLVYGYKRFAITNPIVSILLYYSDYSINTTIVRRL